ncbi:hypothetical protein GCM10010335_69700 [Streptomyces galbus]|nr:hypothetical protein GCM10010335_69700 [Streptomyces galbus]
MIYELYRMMGASVVGAAAAGQEGPFGPGWGADGDGSGADGLDAAVEAYAVYAAHLEGCGECGAQRCVLARCEVPGGPPERSQRGELVLPCLLAWLPDHPGLRRVQQQFAPLLQLPGQQRPALLVDPAPQRKVLCDPHAYFDVVGDGIEAGDLVFLPPAEQGLVAQAGQARFRSCPHRSG